MPLLSIDVGLTNFPASKIRNSFCRASRSSFVVQLVLGDRVLGSFVHLLGVFRELWASRGHRMTPVPFHRSATANVFLMYRKTSAGF